MVSVALNICLQIVEALIAFHFYESISHLTKHKFKRFALVLGGYLAMCLLNLLFDYNAIINAAALLIFHFIFTFVVYKRKIGYSLLLSVLFTCLVGISEISVLNIISIFTKSSIQVFMNDPFIYLLAILFSKSILFFVIRLIISFADKIRTNEKTSFIFLIYPASLLIVIVDFIMISYKYNLDNNSKIILTVSGIVMTAAVIITCIFRQQLSQKEEEIIELKSIKQKQEIENTYFDLLEHQNEELQIFIHDMKKHLNNIYSLAPDSKEVREYVSNLAKDISNSNRIGKTKNKLLDIITDKYDYISKKSGIEFEKDIHYSQLQFIADSDLTSIFNNLLDNAIESAQNSKDKKISLSINSIGNLLTVELSNSCDTPPKTKNKTLISTKSEQGLHGYGFKSVKRAVKKYSGDLEWEYDDTNKLFKISIIFPIA